jgi:hypothetical protein
MANATNNNKLIAKKLIVTNEQTQKTLQHKKYSGGEHVNSKTGFFQKAEFWKRADGTVDDDWFYHHIFHPNTWVNYGGSRHGACLDGYCLYADNRYCSCQEKTEHFEAWEAFDHFEKGSGRFTYQDKDLVSVTHRLKPGRSFSEEDDFDMMDSCHPRDSKAEEEEEAAMAEDWREKMWKRRKRATKDADRLWVFNGMQDAEWHEMFENDSNRLRAYRRKCRYKYYINDDGSTNNGPNPDDPENNGYYPECCFICHQMPCYFHQEEEDWNRMFGDEDKLDEAGNLMTVDAK